MSSRVPIFWAHGVIDRQVPFDLTLHSSAQLAADLGIDLIHKKDTTDRLSIDDLQTDLSRDGGVLRLMEYKDLGHWFEDGELSDLAVWFQAVLRS